MNDTGSDIQTVFDADLGNLHYNPTTYAGPLSPSVINTANGPIARYTIMIEIRLFNENAEPLTDWFFDEAVVTPNVPNPGQSRLSGSEMRNLLYFATAPGNTHLFNAETKSGIISQLPARAR